MAADIRVEKIGQGNFLVRVTEDGSESSHRVTLAPKDYQRLSSGKVEPEVLIKRSFEFLLERESKELILAEFDLSLIGRYFPEYEREIRLCRS